MNQASYYLDDLNVRRYQSRLGLFIWVETQLFLWLERYRQRRALLALSADDALLKDIGISRADAVREAAKPFWR